MPRPRQPRVLIMSENMPCPPDRRVLAEATSLARRGCTVSVVCPRGEGQPLRERNADGVRFFRYRQPPQGEGLAGYAVEYGLSLAHALRLMLRIAISPGFDVLQGCNPPDLFFILGALGKAMGKRYIFDQHDLSPELYRSRFADKPSLALRMLYELEGMSYHTADAVLVTNESYRQIALTRGNVPAEKLFVVRNGPRDGWPPAADPDAELRRGKRHLVLYAGVMGPQDGVGDLLLAARHVVDARDDVLFAFLGDGDARTGLEATAKELGLAGHVDFAGWLSDENRIAAYLATADVCVSPEPPSPLNDLSSFVKVVEYLSAGKPLVAYDLPETRHTAGSAAIYARPGDSADLGDRILEVLENPVTAGTMREAALTRSAELTWERQEEFLARAYEYALSRGARVAEPGPVAGQILHQEESDEVD
jgi:glycosyltransferase involved in cell wall biosynthesis